MGEHILDDIIVVRQTSNSEELEEAYALRWRVLRRPWRQPKGSERDGLEESAINIIALLRGRIVGTARLHLNSDIEGQIRYMAVDEAHQHKNVGTKITKFIIQVAKDLKLKRLVLNARERAIRFYEKMGFKVIGKGELLYGEIMHWLMEYNLDG